MLSKMDSKLGVVIFCISLNSDLQSAEEFGKD